MQLVLQLALKLSAQLNVRVGACRVRQPRVDVHRHAASSPAHHPIDVVLLRILPIKREVGPRATVANAAGDEATILGAGATRPGGVYGLELREEGR